MKHIKQLTWQLAIPLVAIGLAGCDFSKPGSGEYWSDAYNWVNFNGTYKSANGGAVVQLPSTAAVGTNAITTNVVTYTVNDEVVGSLSGSLGNYAGNLAHQSIVPGSLQLYSRDWTFNDGGSSNLSNSGVGFAGTGHVFYNSGAWSLDTTASIAPLSIGTPINARYQYKVSTTSGGGTTGGGTTNVLKIYTLTLMQEGNLVNLTDSNGSQYSGRLGSVSGSNGKDGSTTPVNGDQVIAQYEMTGRNNLTGRDVKIVGTLQGNVIRSGATAYYLANRIMVGTWMESDGTTLDISGVAGDITITFNTDTNVVAKVEI